MERKLQLTINHILVPSIQNPYKKEDYFQLVVDGVQIGFINADGIFLLMENGKCQEGVYVNLGVWKDETPLSKSKLFKKHWSAIFDRYPLRMKFIY